MFGLRISLFACAFDMLIYVSERIQESPLHAEGYKHNSVWRSLSLSLFLTAVVVSEVQRYASKGRQCNCLILIRNFSEQRSPLQNNSEKQGSKKERESGQLAK